MDIRLRFLGAAGNVTGSRYLVQVNGKRILVDCGLFQEREFASRNWERFTVPPETIDTLLLTHAHVDHCGLLPKLVREGFRNRIYCNVATAEISEIILLDSAKLQEEDAENKRKRHEREGRRGPYPEVPLYTIDDANDVFPLLSPVPYGASLQIGDGIEAAFHDAGHVLGSSMVTLKISQNGEVRTIVFSGDIGRWGRPILRNPTVFDEADYVIMESTYGDRLHPEDVKVEQTLSDIINGTRKAGGNIVVPSFALERAQELLYYLNKLLGENRIPHLLVFVDSPMASSITEVFERHPELFNDKMSALYRREGSPFDFQGLKMTRTVDESKAINHIKGTVVIIAGSGMCTGGRIKHHLVQNISRPESTILFVGYQAKGTLGRHIIDGSKEVRILGQKYRVKAKITQLQGFSAHADREELLKWVSGIRKGPRRVFVTHGESESALSFAGLLRDRQKWNIFVPEYQEEVVLD
jgi:metallo-beta-lactamase family protein